MKKTIISVLVASITLVGCGDKSEQELLFEQQLKLKQMDQAHERELERLKAEQIKAANQPSHTYIEYDYDYEQPRHEQPANIAAPVHVPQQQYFVDSQNQQLSGVINPNYVADGNNIGDSGYSGGELIAGAAVGAIAGYAAGKLIDSNSNNSSSYSGVESRTHVQNLPAPQTKQSNSPVYNNQSTSTGERVPGRETGNNRSKRDLSKPIYQEEKKGSNQTQALPPPKPVSSNSGRVSSTPPRRYSKR